MYKNILKNYTLHIGFQAFNNNLQFSVVVLYYCIMKQVPDMCVTILECASNANVILVCKAPSNTCMQSPI